MKIQKDSNWEYIYNGWIPDYSYSPIYAKVYRWRIRHIIAWYFRRHKKAIQRRIAAEPSQRKPQKRGATSTVATLF
jgi:hypothetical protein